jgi:hypothetical protein
LWTKWTTALHPEANNTNFIQLSTATFGWLFYWRKPVTKEEVMTAINECAQELGRAPSYPELNRMRNVQHSDYRRSFSCYTQALEACGLQPAKGGQHGIKPELLLKDYAEVARKIGRAPVINEYRLHSKYSIRPLLDRFGKWTESPRGLLEFAEKNGLAEEYADVLEMVREQERQRFDQVREAALREVKGERAKPLFRVLKGRPVYGPPLAPMGIAHAPLNELGVVFLFGMLAERLGFVVMRVQKEFPDCEAMREVEPGRWQLELIEFEYLSRNFLTHGHDPAGCDVIVCWEHNWPECPENLEVIELKKELEKLTADWRG